MKDKWLVTIEIDTYDGDPRYWDWVIIFSGKEDIKIISSNRKGRVFPTQEGESDQDSISWGELAELTHATQLERFNWCSCEEQEDFPYSDCPRKVV